MPGHVVVAPDKFKGSLGAAGVAQAVADGLRAAVPGLDAREHPVADGGDGTVEAALSAGFTREQVRCTGPTGEPVTAALAVREQVAVVELAEASGLRRLPGGRLAASLKRRGADAEPARPVPVAGRAMSGRPEAPAVPAGVTGRPLPGSACAGERLGPDHVGVSWVGRKFLAPRGLALAPRSVDTDALHLSSPPPITIVAGPLTTSSCQREATAARCRPGSR